MAKILSKPEKGFGNPQNCCTFALACGSLVSVIKYKDEKGSG